MALHVHSPRPDSATSYSVGRIYPNWQKIQPKIPHDGAHYNFDRGGHRLMIVGRNLRPKEIRGFNYGTAYFGVAAHAGVLFLAARFGTGLPVIDAPYSIHMVPSEHRVLPQTELAAGDRALLQTHLIDSASGVLRGIRFTTWSPDFTRAIHTAIHKQASCEISREEYNRRIATAYSRWPTSGDILNDAFAFTFAGE